MLGVHVADVALDSNADRIGVAMRPADTVKMLEASESLVPQFPATIPPMERVTGSDKPAFDPQSALEGKSGNYIAIISGSLDAPVLYAPKDELSRLAGPLSLVAATARNQLPVDYPKVEQIVTKPGAASPESVRKERGLLAQGSQTLMFLLVVMLAGMVLSNMVEEKTNKVIEILAAAIPMEAVFIGKLFAMLGVSLVALAIWGVLGSAQIALLADELTAMPSPATGWPAFILLLMTYFILCYLLIGSLFLATGSLATTVRDVQTLSMPMTILQLAVFFFVSATASVGGSRLEWAAVIFPLSSPYAMAARAAQESGFGQHFVAIAYQSAWVLLTLVVGSRLFRKWVMQSGPTRHGWFARLRGRLKRKKA